MSQILPVRAVVMISMSSVLSVGALSLKDGVSLNTRGLMVGRYFTCKDGMICPQANMKPEFHGFLDEHLTSPDEPFCRINAVTPDVVRFSIVYPYSRWGTGAHLRTTIESRFISAQNWNDYSSNCRQKQNISDIPASLDDLDKFNNTVAKEFKPAPFV